MRSLACVLLLVAGCHEAIDAGGVSIDAGPDDDPLVFDDAPEPGSFDDIHERVIVRSCAGQPGLCHAGQFEPDLSTPGSAYAYLVNRPGYERADLLRVSPGDAENSLLVAKLRGVDVATQMPLGADPLPEAEIAEIEAWIEAGALRRPGAAPPPKLNELPYPPEIAIYAGATRIDAAGTVTVSPGQALTLRQSVKDHETADSAMPAVVFVLQVPDGRSVVLRPGVAQDPHVGIASFDAAAPFGTGDLLNWKLDWTVPAQADLFDDATDTVTPGVSLAGMTITVVGLYVDSFAADGMSAFAFKPNALKVQ
jgi:hypothetical protein